MNNLNYFETSIDSNAKYITFHMQEYPTKISTIMSKIDFHYESGEIISIKYHMTFSYSTFSSASFFSFPTGCLLLPVPPSKYRPSLTK